ncbi:BREX system P-loop protein BrxC [Leptospira ognonensis]|uniref:BREX system P-loop protein BrxC n=1 Tax=Leptospira ognonensis TaxID=2484945 RepID=A0A4R9K375_9LEPT|nr:BREX system P-loop protein BrxC [Leptospira ognonensis]
MTLQNIFEKPVDRPIEGVIKADDQASLRTEIDEYILTNQVEQRLEDFLDAYIDPKVANGVWISGFFGSGKSHLLKMLALLLENREIENQKTGDIFLSKVKDNEILRASIQRAVAIPSKSILFNIDQKADVISKTQTDALLAVFVKVFDEMFGYYGKQSYIAQFERDLDEKGLYEKFQTSFGKFSKFTWVKGREQSLLEVNNIAKAYADVTGESETLAHGILEKYRTQFKLSIEDFAENVKRYLDKQPSNFRLNFFVDEVGQYIAENKKLMTNLQTIAESLATKCRGRAWILVTAQEDMATVVGDMTTNQSNDFSKIQARFASRLKLTSANVEVVIQKRLLLKNEKGIRELADIYKEEVNNLKTLFDFADSSREYPNFTDKDNFIHCYPFIPYQFQLFQSAIQELSLHNAFEGKHSSVGERSMLGVFQQVAIRISKNSLGQLATFDLMFEGIRTSLKSNIQRAIIQAEKDLGSTFAVSVLKTLFLVKYVKEFKPTIRNICVLMISEFKMDLPKHKKNVEEALSILEQQTYIQRTGELFEFLTDEEKDVEEEIKSTDVDTTDISQEMEKIIFDQIIKNKKIRYSLNGQDYPYSRKLDDKVHGREFELAIHVISPFNENANNENVLILQNSGKDELLVLMPTDDRIVRDLMMYKRTEKYVRQNISKTQAETVKRILNDKAHQNQDRYRDIEARLKVLLGKAKLAVAGTVFDVSSEDGQARITKGFDHLISKAYPNLRMLRSIEYKEETIKSVFSSANRNLESESHLHESEQELLSQIKLNHASGVRTTLKSLIEKFEKKPYGWSQAAVIVTLAEICVRGKIDVRQDSNSLEDSALEKALLNSHGYSNLILDPLVEVTGSQLKSLKSFYHDFFDKPAVSSDAKALAKDTSVAMQSLATDVEGIVKTTSQYPFHPLLVSAASKIKEVSIKPSSWYITDLSSAENELLDLKEKVLTPIKTFLNGSQKGIFDSAISFLKSNEPNFTDLKAPEVKLLSDLINDQECFKGNKIQLIKTNLDVLQDTLKVRLAQEFTKANGFVTELKDKLTHLEDFAKVGEEKKKAAEAKFSEFAKSLEGISLIPVIRDSVRKFEEYDFQSIINSMLSGAETGASTPQIVIKNIRSLPFSFPKAILSLESDVDEYLQVMKASLMTEIGKGNKVQI